MTRQNFFKKSILAVFFMLLVTVSGCGAIGNDSQFTQMNQAFLPDATKEAASMEEAASQADGGSMAPGEKQLQERDAAASGEDKNSGKKDGASNTGNPVSDGKNGNDSGNNADGSMGNEGNSSADGETGSSAGDKTEGSEDDNVDGNRMEGSTGNHVSSSEPNNNIGSNADGNGVKSNEGNNANGNKAKSSASKNTNGNKASGNTDSNVSGNKAKNSAGKNANSNQTKGNTGSNANGNKAKNNAGNDTSSNKIKNNASSNKAKSSNANKNKDKSSQKSSKIHKNTAKPPANTAKPSPVKKPQPTAAPGEGKKLCTISIECKTILSHMDKLDSAKKPFVPEDGIILPETSVELQQGDTVFDILSRVCEERKIHMEASYTPLYGTYYVEGIHQLYEFDCGKDMSGWKYFVNGVSVNYSCSKYKVKPGDVICWRYTCDGGRDLEKGAAKGNTEEDIWEKSGL